MAFLGVGPSFGSRDPHRTSVCRLFDARRCGRPIPTSWPPEQQSCVCPRTSPFPSGTSSEVIIVDWYIYTADTCPVHGNTAHELRHSLSSPPSPPCALLTSQPCVIIELSSLLTVIALSSLVTLCSIKLLVFPVSVPDGSSSPESR